MGLQTHSGVPRASSAGWWLSLPHLLSNSSDFLSLPSYIIVQSPTQSLEWHVWLSSSRNNCHAVHRSLSSVASVYECTMGFYFVPYRQPSPLTQFLLITAIRMCHFLLMHHFGMACLAGSKVNIQQNGDTISLKLFTIHVETITKDINWEVGGALKPLVRYRQCWLKWAKFIHKCQDKKNEN